MTTKHLSVTLDTFGGFAGGVPAEPSYIGGDDDEQGRPTLEGIVLAYLKALHSELWLMAHTHPPDWNDLQTVLVAMSWRADAMAGWVEAWSGSDEGALAKAAEMAEEQEAEVKP